jgi:hypothetical protein
MDFSRNRVIVLLDSKRGLSFKNAARRESLFSDFPSPNLSNFDALSFLLLTNQLRFSVTLQPKSFFVSDPALIIVLRWLI